MGQVDLPSNPVLPLGALDMAARAQTINALRQPRPEGSGAPASDSAAIADGRSRAASAGERAAKDFESVLLLRLLEEMRRTIPQSGLLDDAAGEQVQDLFWYYLAQDLSSRGGLGMWKELYRQMGSPAPSGPGTSGSGPSVENAP